MERLLLGLVWSEVTVPAVQEGNLEGMVLHILCKILFNLKQGLQWNRSAFAFQRNGGGGWGWGWGERHRILDLEGPPVLTPALSHTFICPFPT